MKFKANDTTQIDIFSKGYAIVLLQTALMLKAKLINSKFNLLLVLFSFIVSTSVVTSQTTITSSIGASTDDVEEAGSNGGSPGNMLLTSLDLEMTQDDAGGNAGTQKIGLRFNGINVPKGATITNAYITFRAVNPTSPNTNSGVTNLTINGQAADNPGTFSTTTYDLSNRSVTSSSVAWSSIASWTTGVSYNTPAINSVVQELVNRSGWSSGNSMVLIITGTGHRSAEAWDDAAANQPVLTIQYTTISLSASVTNVSTIQGSNGAIDLTVTSGTSPYAYIWSNGLTTQDLTGLTAATYTVTVTDNNGATATSAWIVQDGLALKQLYLSGATQLMDREDPISVSQSLKSSGTLTSPSIGVLNAEYRTFDEANTFYGTYTSPDGPDRVLLVGISVRNRNDIFVISVTYNGVALTQIATIDNNEEALVYIYTMVNPPVGSYYLDVDFNSNVTRAAVIGIQTLHGVHQTTPTGTPSTAIGNSNSMSLNIASAVGDLVVSVVSKRNASSSFTTSQTQRYSAYLDETRGAGNSTVATTTSTTLNWTSTNGSGYAMAGVAVKQAGGNPTTTFTQSPAMCSDFVIKAGTVTVKNYLSIISGTMPSNPNITAVLKYDAVNIITLTNPSYNSSTGLLTWTGTLGSDVTVPSGKAIVLEVTTNQTLVHFQIQYDHSSKPSLIEFSTSTYINTTSVGVYNGAWPGGSLITSAAGNTPVYVRANASDPFGYSDITGLNISVANPSLGPYAASIVSSSGCSRTYEYTLTTPSIQGDIVIAASAKEGYENTVSHSGYSNFSICPLSVSNTVTQLTSCVSNNGSISLNVTGATGPYTWSWNRTSPTGSGSGSGTQITGLAPGSYTITVTSLRGCTGTTTAVLNIPQPPSATGTITNVSCYNGVNGQIVQNISGGFSPFTYQWSGSGVSTKDRSGLSVGNYSMTVTDSGGCTSTQTYEITQPAVMVVNTNKTDPTCITEGNITFSTSGGGNTAPFSWNWTRISPSGSGNGTGTSINNLSHGTYAVTVTSAAGCTATSNVSLTEPLPPTASAFITDLICFGQSNGIINQLVQNGTLPYTYQWADSGVTTVSRTGLTAGSYSVTITDGKNCTVSKNYQITQPNVIIITPTVLQPSCSGKGSVGILITGGRQPYVFDWADMDGNQNTQSRTGLAAGIYSLTVTDNNGCTSTFSSQLNEPNCQPALEICISELSETFSTDADAFTDSYTWVVPAGAVITSGQGTPVIRVNWSGVAQGEGTICVKKSNTCGESSEFCENIYIKGVNASVLAPPVCTGADLVLYASGGMHYSWSGPDGFISSSDNPIRYNANATYSGYYTVTVTDAEGCMATAGININIADGPMTSLQVYNSSCGLANGYIDLSVFGGAVPYNYLWSDSSNSQDNFSLGRGTYFVTVTDNNGCPSVTSASVGEVNGPAVTLNE
ncbi:MAG: SprB repeat-containing protein, partial [Saprospiraceae bacterium]|nr:SprB repeat-containing protein [Saprospiraceae bacterium]